MDRKRDVLELFFENPSEEFYLRQMARKIKVPKTTLSRILKELLKEKLITKIKSEPFDNYTANTEYPLYRFYKKQCMLERIHKSELIDYLVNEAQPKAIIMFGSCAKGEHDEKSDIDLFVQSHEETLNLERFEKKTGHKISIIFEQELRNISEELRNNIINGTILYGMIRL